MVQNIVLINLSDLLFVDKEILYDNSAKDGNYIDPLKDDENNTQNENDQATIE